MGLLKAVLIAALIIIGVFVGIPLLLAILVGVWLGLIVVDYWLLTWCAGWLGITMTNDLRAATFLIAALTSAIGWAALAIKAKGD